VSEPITGQDLKDARSRLDMSQREFAQLLHHGTRTIVDWERDGVPDHKVPLVRAVLGNDLVTPGVLPPLEAYSDSALVREIMRRLEARGPTDPPAGKPRPKTGRGAKKPDDQT
jgi:DNA-binding XRE family transcriptional regulator